MRSSRLGLLPAHWAGIVSCLMVVTPAAAQSTPKAKAAAKAEVAKTETQDPKDVPEIDVLSGMRSGALTVDAEGTGDGRMTLSVTNKTGKPLRVVLPPGLIASGATGQFGGMGGMGMGGMGGGMMGGMGGGMGGMGGGMGGMGGGMGGMGGGMGGMGGMGGGAMPAMMGMRMLAMIIMNLTGDRESWDLTSFTMGMGGMGGMGMGGGMMGGMGGGMGGMGMMGGGMRSIPPTSLPHATFQPGQTRSLPTRLVNLGGPDANGQVPVPAKGEKLEIGSVDQLEGNVSPLVQAALKRLAQDKAPEVVSQLVMWRLAGVDWRTIHQISRRWANDSERALAADLVARLERDHGKIAAFETGTLYIEFATKATGSSKLVDDLKKLFEEKPVLGLVVKDGIPARPDGPSVACRITLLSEDEAVVQVSTTDPKGAWISSGKFSLALTEKGAARKADVVADNLADGLLTRLVRVQLTKGPKQKGKDTYSIKVDNVSPLLLNGVALSGEKAAANARPSALAGFSIPPRRSLKFPASADAVERLGLKDGVRAIAADLSGL